jgi:ribosomal protein S6--L-glutamate ligase
LIKAIEDRGHTYESHDPRDLYLFVSESTQGYDRIYNGSYLLDKPLKLKASDYDAVVSRIGAELAHGAAVLRQLNENLNIYSPQDADGLETASNKLKTTQRLSSGGLKVPKTVYGKRVAHVDFIIDKIDGLPAIAKLLQGSQGKGVMLLETKLATNTMLESFYKLNATLKLQRFIDADGKDIRAIVIGDKVSVAMERTSNKGDFRANISRQGTGRVYELTSEQKTICVNAAKACNLEFAGVDIMQDKEGQTYVVEVNGNPGTKIIGITGHNYFNDLIGFIESKVDKERKGEEDKANARAKGVEKKIASSLYVSKEDREFLGMYNSSRGRS